MNPDPTLKARPANGAVGRRNDGRKRLIRACEFATARVDGEMTNTDEGVEGNAPHADSAKNRLAKLMWLLAGTISLAIGVVGIILPILPTTPFLLLAAACYLRGSKRMYRWMVSNRYVGRYLSDYVEGRGVTVRAKAVSIVILWSMISLSAALATDSLVLRTVLVLVAVAVTIHISLLRTRH